VSTTLLSVPVTPHPHRNWCCRSDFLRVMWAAASSDLMATHFKLTIEGVINTLAGADDCGPIAAFMKLPSEPVLALQRKDREIALHGYESGRIVRCPVASMSRFTNSSMTTSAGVCWTLKSTSPSPCAPTTMAKSLWEPAFVLGSLAGSSKTGSCRTDFSHPKHHTGLAVFVSKERWSVVAFTITQLAPRAGGKAPFTQLPHRIN
jgi:hypothetical protein